MDKMLDSGSDDGGSIPFGCTKYAVNPNKIRVSQKLLYKSIVQLKPFAIMSDGFFYFFTSLLTNKKNIARLLKIFYSKFVNPNKTNG